MTIVAARFVWTVDDLTTGRKLVRRAQRKPIYEAIFFLLAAGMVGLFFKYYGAGLGFGKYAGNKKYVVEGWAIVGGLVAIGIITGIPIAKATSRRLIRRQFSKRPDAGVMISWEFAEDGIIIASLNSRTEAKWAAFQQVFASTAGILFMPSRQIFHYLPARAFASPEEMEAVAEMAGRLTPGFKRLK